MYFARELSALVSAIEGITEQSAFGGLTCFGLGGRHTIVITGNRAAQALFFNTRF